MVAKLWVESSTITEYFLLGFCRGDFYLSYKVDCCLSAPDNHKEIVESCVFVYKLLTTTNVILYHMTLQERWI